MEDQNIITEHHESDLDDLIQYEEVHYDYEESGDDDIKAEYNQSMEEEHLEYEEEDSRPVPVAITKVSLPVTTQYNISEKPTIVRSK